MDKKYLTYQDLVANIDKINSKFIKGDVDIDCCSILFTPHKIIFNYPYSIILYDIINLVRVNFLDEIIGPRIQLIISKLGCKINRGGWIENNTKNKCWSVWEQYKYYDIIDFWICGELKKNPEIIKRILISRLSYAGNPSETDKFQGFWIGDVRILYNKRS